MYYIVYKTTNIINGKFYIGAHRTNNLSDSYLGSGVALKSAIKKYGIENFVREIVHIAADEHEMFLVEEKLISENMGENCYNIMPGGKGGFDHINKTDMHRGDNNIMRDPEIRKKVIDSMMLTRSKSKEKYDKISRKNLEFAVKANTGKKRPEHSKFMKSKMEQNWKNNRESIRDSLSSFFELTSPEGLVYTTNRLEEFCENNFLTYTAIWNSSVKNKPVKKGKSKGWICKKI